jgi:hypothetical protein
MSTDPTSVPSLEDKFAATGLRAVETVGGVLVKIIWPVLGIIAYVIADSHTHGELTSRVVAATPTQWFAGAVLVLLFAIWRRLGHIWGEVGNTYSEVADLDTTPLYDIEASLSRLELAEMDYQHLADLIGAAVAAHMTA